MDKSRRCKNCGVEKLLTAEFWHTHHVSYATDPPTLYFRHVCKKCRLESENIRYKKYYKEIGHIKHRVLQYNISIKDFKNLYANQNGRCAICTIYMIDRDIQLDHNHVTNKNRGLLCHKCNQLISNCNENIDVLQDAIKYLRKWSDAA